MKQGLDCFIFSGQPWSENIGEETAFLALGHLLFSDSDSSYLPCTIIFFSSIDFCMRIIQVMSAICGSIYRKCCRGDINKM